MTAQPNTIVLDGVPYAIDLADYRFGPLDTFRDSVTQSDQPTDALFNARGAWARYQTSWHHGADQEVRDFLEESDPYRFDQSYGFDTWGRLGLKLLGATRENTDAPITSSPPLLLRAGTWLFMAEGANVWVAESTDLNETTTWFNVANGDGTIHSLATDGSTVYIAAEGGLRTTTNLGPPDEFGTPINGATQKVAFVANRLLIGQDNVLSEVAAAGTLTAIITHFQANFRWTTLFALGSRIYVGGYAGINSELYSLTTDSGGALVAGPEATSIPRGELLLTAVSTGGACLIGTSKGIRFAQQGADGTLSYGPLIDKVGSVSSIVVDGRYAWVSWNDTTTHLATDSPNQATGLARLDLATFIDVLQPAYATDIYRFGNGSVTSVERYEGGFGTATVFVTDTEKLYFTYDDGAFPDSTTEFQATAKITSGELFFGTMEVKGLVSVEVLFAPLPSGCSVAATVFDELGNEVATGTQSTDAATSLSVDLGGERVRSCSLVIEVASAGGTAQVEILSWRMQAYPAPPQSLQWQLPIITHQRAEMGDGEGQTLVQTPRGVISHIEALHRTRELVQYTEGDTTYEVRVENFSHVARMWSDDGSAPVGIVLVQLVGSAT